MSVQLLSDKLQAVVDYVNTATDLLEVEGFLHPIEGFALLLLAQHGPGKGAIVEIGSFMELSTCWLARGSQHGGREPVTAIDHFTGSPEHQPGADFASSAIEELGTTYHQFEANTTAAGIADRVSAVRASSLDAVKTWQDSIRLLFIDGDHSYEAARADFEAWTPFVAVGGLVALHDVGTSPDVTRLYDELIEPGSDYTEFLRLYSLGVLVKGQP